MDDIIFGSTNVSMYEWFSMSLHSEFDMSMMRELDYFLDLKIKQTPHSIYVHQAKYVRNLLNFFGFENIKSKLTSMSQVIKLTIDEIGKMLMFNDIEV